MKTAIEETNRRRRKQLDYNTANGIEPFTVIKAVHEYHRAIVFTRSRGRGTRGIQDRCWCCAHACQGFKAFDCGTGKEMKEAAGQLHFEQAAGIRDRIIELKILLAEESDIPPWKKARLMAGEID